MYETLTHFAQTWGMIYALILFAGVLAYTFWPQNKATFDHAARIPLEAEDGDDQ